MLPAGQKNWRRLPFTEQRKSRLRGTDRTAEPRWFFANLVRVVLPVERQRDARWLAVCTPGDFERFVIAASRPAERDELPPHGDPPSEEQIAAVTALAAEHGIELLGPPGALP